MERTNIWLPKPIKTALKALAKVTGLSASEHVRRAIEEYLAKRRGK